MICEPSLRAWCEIDLDAMLHNFMAARHHLPDEVLLAAVIKADAYGHGAVAAAKLLEGKADRFAVAMTDEGVELRRAGIRTPIFLLGPTPETDFEAIAAYDIDKATVSRDVRTLTERGYVVSAYSETNRRKRVLSLTPEGRMLFARILEISNDMTALLTTGLRKREINALCRLIEHMDGNSDRLTLPDVKR